MRILDKIDYQIINLLFNDARTPFKTIAKILGIGTDTVIRRYGKLKEKGIILNSTVVLSSQACGFKGVCAFMIKIESGTSISAARAELYKIRQIYYIGHMWGDYDFYLELYFRDSKEIFDLVSELRNVKGVVAIDQLMYVIEEWPLPGAFPPDFLAQKFGVRWKSERVAMPINPNHIDPKEKNSTFAANT
jgi:DNA-binding Lrp family transcriptional regulator